MMSVSPVIKSRLKLVSDLTRLLLTYACLSIASEPLLGQDLPVASSGITESGLSLSFEVRGIKYQRDQTITVKYRVANRESQDVYLISVGKVTPSYQLDRRELVIGLEKEILNYHYFDYPQLERIKQRESHQGEANLSLPFLRQHFGPGKWLLYISIGYLDARGMDEIKGLLKTHRPQELAQQFDQRQKILMAGPIEIELVN